LGRPEESERHSIKLLLFLDSNTGIVLYGSYMSTSGTGQDFLALHYKSVGDFSGTVYYHHFNGRLSNGWIYDKGTIRSSVSVIDRAQYEAYQRKATDVMVCQSGMAEKYVWGCVGAGNYMSCDWQFMGYEYVSICQEQSFQQDDGGGGGGGGYIPPIRVDCAGVAGGTATWSTECNTCIGGTTGLTGCPREIKVDTSINNNPKIKCLMEKLLGLDGTAGNAQMKSLLAAFNSKGFDVTFKIGTTKPESWGETAEDPYNPTKYNVVLNRNKINGGYQMDWVKTLLHEAFHANLLQKTYELFGASAIALWDKNPGNMSFNELMDYVSMKATTSGNPVLKAEHHNFMARNFEVIRDGLKSFSLANNPNHSDYNDFHFDAFAYQGLTGTSYYLNNVIKNPDGTLKTITINGHQLILSDVNDSFYIDLRKENIPCN